MREEVGCGKRWPVSGIVYRWVKAKSILDNTVCHMFDLLLSKHHKKQVLCMFRADGLMLGKAT